MRRWSAKSEIRGARFVAWLDISTSKFYSWRKRYGKVNEHNGWIPRDRWLEQWEKQAILDFYREHPLEGYRRLSYMMLDADTVAVSPSSVWRVLSQAGVLAKWNKKISSKGSGFQQPSKAHEHWHIDISYINIRGTFYYLCSVLDGFSRAIVHWDLRESMKEAEVEVILQRARELQPQARPRIISDNGPQFLAKDFKEFIRVAGMTHVRTSPYYPQSNGKIERWHQSLKSECLRPLTPLSADEGRRFVDAYVKHYNEVRLHSAIGYVTPNDMLAGRQTAIHSERDRKLEEARRQRQLRRRRGDVSDRATIDPPGETEAGTAGMQPCRGIARRAHRDDDRRREETTASPAATVIGSIDPNALKIPARRAESSTNGERPFSNSG